MKIAGSDVRFCVSTRPRPTPRPKFSGHAYMEAWYRVYQDEVKLNAKAVMRGRMPMQKPICVLIAFTFPYPKSWGDKKKDAAKDGTLMATGHQLGDIDNLEKAVLDACNGIVYRDDSQIVSLSAWKQYGKRAMVDVNFCELSNLKPCNTTGKML